MNKSPDVFLDAVLDAVLGAVPWWEAPLFDQLWIFRCRVVLPIYVVVIDDLPRLRQGGDRLFVIV